MFAKLVLSVRGKGENAKKWQKKGKKHTKTSLFLPFKSLHKVRSSLATTQSYLFEALTVKPTAGKTVGCVPSEILMNFHFFTFPGAEKR